MVMVSCLTTKRHHDGGFRVKNWVYLGDSHPVEICELSNNLRLKEASEERMLGVSWDPKEDTFRFKVRINLSPLKKKLRMEPDITRQEPIDSPPKIITRRQSEPFRSSWVPFPCVTHC